MENKIPIEAKLVYQGGHHNVYCDGKNHFFTRGGYCHPEINKQETTYRHINGCDCEKYKENK